MTSFHAGVSVADGDTVHGDNGASKWNKATDNVIRYPCILPAMPRPLTFPLKPLLEIYTCYL